MNQSLLSQVSYLKILNLPWAFWNPRRGVKIIVFPEKGSILHFKRKSITITFERIMSSTFHSNVSFMDIFKSSRLLAFDNFLFIFIFCLKTSSNIWRETQILLNILRVSLGAAQIFHSHLWTVFAEFYSSSLFCLPCIHHCCSALGHPVGHHPNSFLPQSTPSPKLGRQQAPLEGLHNEGNDFSAQQRA